MFDAPIESAYVWLGLAAVSASMLGLALEAPTAPPPDPSAVARTVDNVAASPHEATARQPVDADRIRLGSDGIELSGPGGDAHAAFAYGPVVPAFGDDALGAVLRGRPPEAVFTDREGFRDALDRARTHSPDWRAAPERLTVRRVTWGAVDATLVGV
jgi:hypothetical protein